MQPVNFTGALPVTRELCACFNRLGCGLGAEDGVGAEVVGWEGVIVVIVDGHAVLHDSVDRVHVEEIPIVNGTAFMPARWTAAFMLVPRKTVGPGIALVCSAVSGC